MADDIVKSVSEILKIIDNWFGSAIRRKLNGKEMRAVLLLKDAGYLVRPMDHLYGTFFVLVNRLRMIQMDSQDDERTKALTDINDFTSNWIFMPVIVHSLGSLNATVSHIADEDDKKIVIDLITYGKDFLKQAGVKEDGRVDEEHTWPTPWVNAEQFDRLLDTTMNAKTNNSIMEVRAAVNQALAIFKQDTVVQAGNSLGALQANIRQRYPDRIPDPTF